MMLFVHKLAERILKPLAVASAAGMWIVLIMGATVTNTGSARGCADTWPLCRGQFIPQMAVSTAIEYSHRSVVAVLTVLIIALAVSVWLLYSSTELRVLSAVMVAFLFLQAGLGAWAVMSPQNAAVLALHFGVSLIAFASVVLVAASVFEPATGSRLRSLSLPRYFSAYAWTITIFSFGEVYLGAYVRHRNADDACTGWPLCNGKVLPSLRGLVAANFSHRLAAFVLSLAIAGLVLWAARIRHQRPDIWKVSLLAAGLVVLQAISGAIIVATDMDLFSALLHAALVALLFGTLSYLCLRTSRVREASVVPSLATGSAIKANLGAGMVGGAD